MSGGSVGLGRHGRDGCSRLSLYCRRGCGASAGPGIRPQPHAQCWQPDVPPGHDSDPHPSLSVGLPDGCSPTRPPPSVMPFHGSGALLCVLHPWRPEGHCGPHPQQNCPQGNGVAAPGLRPAPGGGRQSLHKPFPAAPSQSPRERQNQSGQRVHQELFVRRLHSRRTACPPPLGGGHPPGPSAGCHLSQWIGSDKIQIPDPASHSDFESDQRHGLPLPVGTPGAVPAAGLGHRP
mmetsp:Transcript_14033/g.25083  ORF Transcript_14033/g.25083 Transcript_14033/m.25083 type:complete len:234 (+) Transcript_14033:603-1304(+)